jgi:hypothetical protein
MVSRFILTNYSFNSCQPVARIDNLQPVTSKLKWLQLTGCAALLFFAAGCGGFQAAPSFSPLNLLLPGLIKNDPQPAKPAVTETNSVTLLANAR